MKSWLIMMGGLILWAVHVFLLYLLAEFGGSGSGIRLAASFFTLGILGGVIWMFIAVSRGAPGDAFAGWRRRAAMLALAFGGVGIVFQYLPILLVDR